VRGSAYGAETGFPQGTRRAAGTSTKARGPPGDDRARRPDESTALGRPGKSGLFRLRSLTAEVMRALHSQQTSFHGEDACGGYVGPSACPHRLRFNALATYRS
jgi:hypothetical protein